MARPKAKVSGKRSDVPTTEVENTEPARGDNENNSDNNSSDVSESRSSNVTYTDSEAPPSNNSSSSPTPSSTAVLDSTLKFFVGGLHPNTDESELSTYFCKYGQILAVQVMRDLMTGRQRGFGFVTIKLQPNSMDVFKDAHIITGKRVDVRTMQTDAAASLKKKIFVGGLSKALNEEMLQEYFSKFGEVDKVTIMRQLDGTSRGFGFIVFTADNAAENALKTPSHFVYGNKVDVRAAETRAKTAANRADSAYQYGVMPVAAADMYSAAAVAAMYRPQLAKEYASYYKQGAYDSQQYANLTQQQMMQQQYAMQQQMVQQQMTMSVPYGSYYDPTNQQGYTQDPSRYPTQFGYGAYRGKNDSTHVPGSSNGSSGNSSGTRNFRQEPY